MKGLRTNAESRYFLTSEGVSIHFLEKGKGPPLILIPGWSQTALQFKFQIEALSGSNHCLSIDMGGHGESDKPDNGYTIERLSKDLHELIQGLGLENVNLLGHSLGCAVLWSFIDLFGTDNINKLILVDEPPFLLINPDWSEIELLYSGALFTSESLMETVNGLKGPDGVKITQYMIEEMFTDQLLPEDEEWIMECTLKFPRQYAADLLLDHATKDWRDLIPRIDVPTLIFGARGSHVPSESQKWIHEQIKGSELVLFEEEDNCKHFIFLENPEKFNAEVSHFMGEGGYNEI